MTELALAHGLAFEDLYNRDGLVRLDGLFVEHLKGGDVELHNRLMTARATPDALENKAESDLLVDLAPHLEDFLSGLFGIGAEIRAMQARHHELAPLYSVKRLFVQRRAVKGVTPEQAAAIDGKGLVAQLRQHFDFDASYFDQPKFPAVRAFELFFAAAVAEWMSDEAANAAKLDLAAGYYTI